MPDLTAALVNLLRSVALFTDHLSGVKLRRYQVQVAERIADSVLNRRGDSIVVMFPRQSGKNELQAHVEAYLLTLFSELDGELVKASPTWKPQSLNAMRRLQRVLKRNLITRDRHRGEQGYIFSVGHTRPARIYFMSAEPAANVVGHTAKTLLQCDEAQDVQPAKWDKDFAPMAASTNATRVFWGTAWTSRTLLARELRAARAAEKVDGRRRAFTVTATDVAAEVPAYGAFVAAEVAKHGRQHPLIKTQYFGEEIDADGGLFPPARRALLAGTHAPQTARLPGHTYALLIDIAGANEASTADPAADTSSHRDSTALTVVDVDMATLGDPLIHAPTYRVVARHGWTGIKHANLYPALRGLIEHWQPRYVVIDATGMGEGLASFLVKAYPDKVLPFIFSAQSKSELGWSFLSLIESGRCHDYAGDDPARAEFWEQLEFTEYTTTEQKQLRWSVPDGTRNPATGRLVHDDWIMSLALAAHLDAQPWGVAKSAIIPGFDPIAGMRGTF